MSNGLVGTILRGGTLRATPSRRRLSRTVLLFAFGLVAFTGAVAGTPAADSHAVRAGTGYSPYMCSKVIGPNPPNFVPKPKFNYVGKSRTKWRAEFQFASIQACKGKGIRSVTLFQEQSTDGGRTWAKSSNVFGAIRSNKPICDVVRPDELKCARSKTATLTAPFDCSNRSSTSVRATFRVHWIASSGNDNTRVYSFRSKKPAC